MGIGRLSGKQTLDSTKVRAVSGKYRENIRENIGKIFEPEKYLTSCYISTVAPNAAASLSHNEV
jgi:hypothetical protein